MWETCRYLLPTALGNPLFSNIAPGWSWKYILNESIRRIWTYCQVLYCRVVERGGHFSPAALRPPCLRPIASSSLQNWSFVLWHTDWSSSRRHENNCLPTFICPYILKAHIETHLNMHPNIQNDVLLVDPLCASSSHSNVLGAEQGEFSMCGNSG